MPVAGHAELLAVVEAEILAQIVGQDLEQGHFYLVKLKVIQFNVDPW